MIWFTCKQCGKRHSRAEGLAGTLVFCDCGQGNRVPWASTTAPAEPLDAQPVPVPVPPSRPRTVPREIPEALPTGPPPAAPLPPRPPASLPRKVRPEFCFNHDEDASTGTCAACRLPFCPNCLVALGGQTLCGPCKNFRVGGMGRPPRVLPLAVVALVVSLVSGPVTLILSLVAVGLHIGEGTTGEAVGLCILALVLPVAGLVLAGMALRRIDARPQLGGRALAASGACAALVGALWCVSVAVLVVVKHLQA
jgi:hypothetical protein